MSSGGIALGARNPQIETIGAVMAEIMHRTVEPGPMLLLFGRELQLLLDPLDIGVAGGDDLFGASVAGRRPGSAPPACLGGRLASPRRPWLLRSSLADFRVPSPASPCLLILCRRRWTGVLLLVAAGQDTGHAGHDAHDAADRAAQHAADRSRRLVAFARAFLTPCNHLRIRRRGAPSSMRDHTPSRNDAIATACADWMSGCSFVWSPSSINAGLARRIGAGIHVSRKLSFSHQARPPDRASAAETPAAPEQCTSPATAEPAAHSSHLADDSRPACAAQYMRRRRCQRHAPSWQFRSAAEICTQR